MSTLNQAFIKVYQQQRVNAPHVRFPGPAIEPAVSVDPPNPSDAVEQSEGSDETGGVRSAEPALAAGAANIATVEQTNRPRAKISATAADAQATVDRDPAGDRDAADDSESSAPPATLVPRFHWPALVESLSEAATFDLRRHAAGGRPSKIVVVSCQRGDGGTTMALLLARQFSLQGARVALVDADQERPALAERLGLSIEIDWQWAWREKLPLEEALVESLADGVALLPLRKAASADARHAGPAALAHILAELAQRYDVVCIDGGPLGARDGEPGVTLTDAAIDLACVVHDARRGQAEQAETIARRLEGAGVQRSITVDNFVRANHV